MELARLLKSASAAPPRAEVERTLAREHADHPDRTYGAILRALSPTPRRLEGDEAEASGRPEGPGDAAPTGPVGTGGKGKAKEEPPKPLPVVVNLTPKRSVSGGLNPGSDAFGLMTPKFRISGLSHKKLADKIEVTGTLFCKYRWGVHSLGRKDVASANARFITVKNYAAVADDIDPDKGPATNAANYDKYWSKSATKAHELEHVRDDWEDFVPVKGVTAAKGVFEAGTVNPKTAKKELSALAKTAATTVMQKSDEHYGASMGYYSRPGEIKAHAVGAAIERPLAAAIRAHGQTLEAKLAAKKAAKDAKKAAKDAKNAPKEAEAEAPPEEGATGTGKGHSPRGAKDRELSRAVDSVMRMFT